MFFSWRAVLDGRQYRKLLWTISNTLKLLKLHTPNPELHKADSNSLSHSWILCAASDRGKLSA